MKIELGEPIVVAQGKEKEYPWGIWQFPNLNRLDANTLHLSFSQAPDEHLDSADAYSPPAVRISSDNGKTWRPAEADRRHGIHEHWLYKNGTAIDLLGPPRRDVPKSDLPETVGKCDSGYYSQWTMRDPLQMPGKVAPHHLLRHHAGKKGWESVPVVIDDPDAAVRSFDPPGKSYTTMQVTGFIHMLELPDKSLLAIFCGWRLGPDRKPHPKMESWCSKSTDGGLTWKFHSVIARDDNTPWVGFCEPTAALMPDGPLLAVLRTECAIPGPMHQTRSFDGGKTWETPRRIHPFGVRPRLLVLDNGVTALSFGRPGVHMLFCPDGKGESWENLTTLVSGEGGPGVEGAGVAHQKGEIQDHRIRLTRSSGYTDVLATGPDTFLLAYDQFDYPNEKGEPRKTILVRNVKVTK